MAAFAKARVITARKVLLNSKINTAERVKRKKANRARVSINAFLKSSFLLRPLLESTRPPKPFDTGPARLADASLIVYYFLLKPSISNNAKLLETN